MLRNDGKLFQISQKELKDFGLFIHPYLLDLELLDIKTIPFNLLLDNFFYGYGLPSLIWFYNHTLNDNAKIESDIIASNFFKKMNMDLPNVFNEIDLKLEEDELKSRYFILNNVFNQEFCKVRFAGKYRIEGNNEIWFRISSMNFNWFDLIWKVVYHNEYSIEYVNICTDKQAKGKEKFYTIGRDEINKFPVKDFLMLQGNPIIESNSIIKDLASGKPLNEAISGNPVYQIYKYNYLLKLEKYEF